MISVQLSPPSSLFLILFCCCCWFLSLPVFTLDYLLVWDHFGFPLLSLSAFRSFPAQTSSLFGIAKKSPKLVSFIHFSLYFFGLFPCLFPAQTSSPFGIIARRLPRLDNGTDRWTSGPWTAQDRLEFSTQSDSKSSSVWNNPPASPFKGLMGWKLDSTLSIYTEPPWF